MIVSPDFLDHWKTQMLIDQLKDEKAPLYVLRLWGHCQLRKAWEFKIPASGIKAICRFDGAAEELHGALLDSGFLSTDGGTVTVCGWDEYNAQLIANWENGKLGGRPKTHGKPMGNPSRTQREPIREDRTREDKNPSSPFQGEGFGGLEVHAGKIRSAGGEK